MYVLTDNSFFLHKRSDSECFFPRLEVNLSIMSPGVSKRLTHSPTNIYFSLVRNVNEAEWSFHSKLYNL